MQALLTRLKAASGEQKASRDVPAFTDQEDGDKKGDAPGSGDKDVNNNKAGFIDAESSELLLDDPSDEIEIVMASNSSGKTPAKRRPPTRASASSPRDSALGKNSRTRGSRVSLASAANSDKEDVSVIDGGAGSEDESGEPRQARILTPMQAWAAFEDTVKNIDNSNPYMFMKKPKPTFVSSGTFQKVMVDMYGNTEYGNTKGYTLLKQKLNNMARASTMATRMFAAASQKGKEDRETDELEEDEPELEDDTAEQQPETVTKVFAKRGWKMLKRQVNETKLEQKTQSGKLNWTMLQHTVKQMSNIERTRQDLYERYGIVPTVMEDGTTICENRMLSDRARAQLYGRAGKDGEKTDNKRPHSYQPPRTNMRPTSQSSFQSKSSSVSKTKDNTVKVRLPSVGKTRKRPVTAVR